MGRYKYRNSDITYTSNMISKSKYKFFSTKYIDASSAIGIEYQRINFSLSDATTTITQQGFLGRIVHRPPTYSGNLSSNRLFGVFESENIIQTDTNNSIAYGEYHSNYKYGNYKLYQNGYVGKGRFFIKNSAYWYKHFYYSSWQGSSDGGIELKEKSTGINRNDTSIVGQEGFIFKIINGGSYVDAKYSLFMNHYKNGNFMQLAFCLDGSPSSGNISNALGVDVVLNRKHRVFVSVGKNINDNTFRLHILSTRHFEKKVTYTREDLGNPIGRFCEARDFSKYYLLFFERSIVKINAETLEYVEKIDFTSNYQFLTADAGRKGVHTLICKKDDDNLLIGLQSGSGYGGVGQYLVMIENIQTNMTYRLLDNSYCKTSTVFLNETDRNIFYLNNPEKGYFVGDKCFIPGYDTFYMVETKKNVLILSGKTGDWSYGYKIRNSSGVEATITNNVNSTQVRCVLTNLSQNFTANDSLTVYDLDENPVGSATLVSSSCHIPLTISIPTAWPNPSGGTINVLSELTSYQYANAFSFYEDPDTNQHYLFMSQKANNDGSTRNGILYTQFFIFKLPINFTTGSEELSFEWGQSPITVDSNPKIPRIENIKGTIHFLLCYGNTVSTTLGLITDSGYYSSYTFSADVWRHYIYDKNKISPHSWVNFGSSIYVYNDVNHPAYRNRWYMSSLNRYVDDTNCLFIHGLRYDIQEYNSAYLTGTSSYFYVEYYVPISYGWDNKLKHWIPYKTNNDGTGNPIGKLMGKISGSFTITWDTNTNYIITIDNIDYESGTGHAENEVIQILVNNINNDFYCPVIASKASNTKIILVSKEPGIIYTATGSTNGGTGTINNQINPETTQDGGYHELKHTRLFSEPMIFLNGNFSINTRLKNLIPKGVIIEYYKINETTGLETKLNEVDDGKGSFLNINGDLDLSDPNFELNYELGVINNLKFTNNSIIKNVRVRYYSSIDKGLLVKFTPGISQNFLTNESYTTMWGIDGFVIDNGQSWSVPSFAGINIYAQDLYLNQVIIPYHNSTNTIKYGKDLTKNTNLENVGGFREVLSDDWNTYSTLYKIKEIPLFGTFNGNIDTETYTYKNEIQGIITDGKENSLITYNFGKWCFGGNLWSDVLSENNGEYYCSTTHYPIRPAFITLEFYIKGEKFNEIDDGSGTFSNNNLKLNPSYTGNINYTTGEITNIKFITTPDSGTVKIYYYSVSRKGNMPDCSDVMFRPIYAIGWYLKDYIGMRNEGTSSVEPDPDSPLKPHIFIPEWWANNIRFRHTGLLDKNDINANYDVEKYSNPQNINRYSKNAFFGYLRGYYNKCKLRIVDAIDDSDENIIVNTSYFPSNSTTGCYFNSAAGVYCVNATIVNATGASWPNFSTSQLGRIFNGYYTKAWSQTGYGLFDAQLSGFIQTIPNDKYFYGSLSVWNMSSRYYYSFYSTTTNREKHPPLNFYPYSSGIEKIKVYSGEELEIEDYYVDNKHLRLNQIISETVSLNDFLGEKAQKVYSENKNNYEIGNSSLVKLFVNTVSNFNINDTVTNGSGASGTIKYKNINEVSLVLNNVIGTFNSLDNITNGGSGNATVSSVYSTPNEMDNIDIWRSSKLKGVVLQLKEKTTECVLLVNNVVNFNSNDIVNTTTGEGIINSIKNQDNLLFIQSVTGTFSSGQTITSNNGGVATIQEVYTSITQNDKTFNTNKITGTFSYIGAVVDGSVSFSIFRGTGVSNAIITKTIGKLLIITSGACAGNVHMIVSGYYGDSNANGAFVVPHFNSYNNSVPSIGDSYIIIDAIPVLFRIDDIGRSIFVKDDIYQTDTTSYTVDSQYISTINNTIGSNSANWMPNSLVGKYVIITSGVNKGEAHVITSNTNKKIYITGNWSTQLIANYTTFEIIDSNSSANIINYYKINY